MGIVRQKYTVAERLGLLASARPTAGEQLVKTGKRE
jgi:hypothetical protein